MALSIEEPVTTVADRVREVRMRHRLTAQDLAERLQGLGLPWERTTVVKLENKRRQTLTVTELMALAVALDVAPVNLLVPLDDRPYQVTPNRTESSDAVRAWVRGEQPLPGTDERTYRTEVSLTDMHRAHTTTLEEQAALIARAKGISLSDGFREIADRLDADGRKGGGRS